MFRKLIDIPKLQTTYSAEANSNDKTKTVIMIKETNENIRTEFLSIVLRGSTRKKFRSKIFKQRRYKKLLVESLELSISYLEWIKKQDFEPHNMEPLKDEISELSLNITDEIRMIRERITSLNGIFVSVVALLVSVGAIIFSIF